MQIVVMAVVQIGLSYLSRALSSKKQSQKFNFDSTPTIISDRGSFVPLVIGRRKVNAICGWAGDRTVIKESTGSGGKGGSKKKSYQYIYYEEAWHMLAVGPATKLYRIREAGNVIYEPTEPITAGNTPSGSSISLGAQGTFRIYWGEADQPIDSVLASRTGVASRWPNVCYIYWDDKRLGGSPVWNPIEYEIEVDQNLGTTPLGASSYSYSDGINPAHILNQLLTAPYPHGCGVNSSELVMDSLEYFGAKCEIEGLSFNIIADDGVSADGKLAEIMQDAGILFVPYNYQYGIKMVRANQQVVTLTDDILTDPDPELEYNCGDRQVGTVIFMFKNKDKNYADCDAATGNDAAGSQNKIKTVLIPSCTTHAAANIVANRRMPEELTPLTGYKLTTTRDGRALRPGHLVYAENINTLRISAVELKDDNGEVPIEAVVDTYGTEPDDYVPEPIDPDEAPLFVAADPYFTFYECPLSVSQNVAIMIMRIRAHAQILGADQYISADNSTYNLLLNESNYCAGGTLESGISDKDSMIIEDGPVFTSYNSDVANVLDLSGAEGNWRTGRQICIINNEWYFLRNLVALGNDQYQLKGLIGGRAGTIRQTHEIGSKVVIFESSSINPIQDPVVTPGLTVYAKTQPFTIRDTFDLGSVTPVDKLITGLVYKPLPPDNFRANTWNKYSAGGDINFGWTYRVRDGKGSAAGEQLAGIPISATKPTRNGYFQIQITGGRTITINDDTGAYEYTNGMIIEDFGSEPASITATLKNLDGAYESIARQITITKE